MAIFCIPKQNIDKMKTVITRISEKDQMRTLVDMTSEKRTRLFKKVLTEEEAGLLNTEFEKAVASQKLRALGDWVKRNLDAKYREDETIFLAKNYKNLDEVNNFIESRVDLMAEQQAGVALTTNEVKKFTELGKNFFEASKEIGDNIGKPDFAEDNIKWGKAYKELADYRESLLPKSWWGGLVQKLGRANMLFSIKTPFLNIESNTINGITESVIRRFRNWQFTSIVEKGVAKDYMKFAHKMFKETGIDFTRMIDFNDTVVGIGKIAGETTQNIGIKGMDKYSDFVFNKLLTTPDVTFASFAFADSLSILATKTAKGDKKLATKLFKEATNINATGMAKMLREQAIADARLATYTNDTLSSQISEKLRQTLNKAGNIGDLIMPFVKTPANVAELSKLCWIGFC